MKKIKLPKKFESKYSIDERVYIICHDKIFHELIREIKMCAKAGSLPKFEYVFSIKDVCEDSHSFVKKEKEVYSNILDLPVSKEL